MNSKQFRQPANGFMSKIGQNTFSLNRLNSFFKRKRKSVATVRLALDDEAERMLGPVPVASPVTPVIPVIATRETRYQNGRDSRNNVLNRMREKHRVCGCLLMLFDD